MGIFNRESSLFCSKLDGLAVLVWAILAVIAVWSSPVSALGMGAANAQSHIGEPLSVHIPIFNVKDPNDFTVILQRTDNAVGAVPLHARLERGNSQLGIRITSDEPTTEPYISFVLEVIDGNDVSSKYFTFVIGP